MRSGGQPVRSAFGGAAGAAVYPLGPHPDARAASSTQRGLLMALADAGGASLAGQSLIEQIRQAYEEVPPDVDRLIALRATLDKANRVLKRQSKDADAPTHIPMVIAAVVGNQWYGIGVGTIRCYCIQASGRIDAIRMEPAAQRKLEPADSLLICTSSVSEKLDEYDIALTVYSRNPQGAVQRLLAMAKEKGAQGALGAIVFGPRRSLVSSILGRSSNK